MIDPEVLNLLELAPVEFDAYCSDPANRTGLKSVEQSLEGIAFGCTRLAAYIAQRHGYGCGN